MIICPYCQHELLEGTILCPECGASLITSAEEAQAVVEQDRQAPQGPGQQEEPSTGGLTTARITATQLRLLVLNSGRTIFCPMSEVILIGRADASGGIFPEVDLSQDNGYMAGVSRRHARVIRRGDDFYLEDLGSMNGTFLNRSRLATNTPVPFEDGDEIRLGNLVLRVILERVQP